MLESLLVYTGTAVILFFMAKRMNSVKTDSFFCNKWFILSVVVFALIVGMRWYVGVDYEMYLNYYKGTFQRPNMEWGFAAITDAMRYYNIHFAMWFALWGAMQIGFTYYAMRYRTETLPFIALAIILGPWLAEWTNGIRQCVIICAFLTFSIFIVKQKFLPYFLCVGVSMLIHKSAIILLPIYLLSYINVEKIIFNSKILISILIVCVIIGVLPIWDNVLPYISWLANSTGYEYYQPTIRGLADNGMNSMNFGITRIMTLLIDATLIFLIPIILRNDPRKKELAIWFIIFFIGVCYFNLLANTHHSFLRIGQYFTIMRLPLVAIAMAYLFENLNKRKLFVATFAYLCIATFSYTYIILIKVVVSPSVSSTAMVYNFFFQYQ